MKFSIIIPIYNAEKYLRDCLNSIRNQKIQDFEALLIDDGSNDGSAVICDEYAETDSRFKVIHQKNQGVSVARNAGLMISTGEWLCFVDSDDKVYPDWLENFQREIADDVDVVVQGATVVNGDSVADADIRFEKKKYYSKDLKDLMHCWQHTTLDMGSLWTKAIRSSIVKDNQLLFDNGISHYEDWIFFTHILVYARCVVTTDAIGYVYNHCNSSLTSNKRKTSVADWRVNISRARYSAAQGIKKVDEDAYQIYLEKVSQLMMQTLYQVYKENYPKQKRLSILNEFLTFDVNTHAFDLKNWVVYFLWKHKKVVISDFCLSVFRFI